MSQDNLEITAALVRKSRSIFGLRLSALIEIALFFLIISAIKIFLGEGNNFFNDSPHPYWLIVILISAQYGTKEGVFASLVSILFYFIGWLPPQTILQDRFEYLFLLAKNPLLWLVTSVVLGELRARQIREREGLITVAKVAADEKKTISEAYESLKKIKERLEKRFASEMQTALTAYQAFRELQQGEISEVLNGAMRLTKTVLSPEKFSLYLLEGGALKMVACEGWQSEDRYPQSIGPESQIFEKIVGRQRVATVTSADDKQLMDDGSIMAVPIVAAHKVYGMLKIEELPFLRLGLSALESFRLIGEWVGTAYDHCIAKKEAEGSRYISKESALFTENFFTYQKDFLTHLGKRLNLDITLLTVSVAHATPLLEEKKLAFLKVFKQIFQSHLRSIDQAFEFENKEYEVALLLINTSVQNAQIVRQKISSDLENALNNEMTFTYKISPINEKVSS